MKGSRDTIEDRAARFLRAVQAPRPALPRPAPRRPAGPGPRPGAARPAVHARRALPAPAEGGRAKTIIHVNQHVIKRNQKTGEREPVLTIKRGKSNTYAHAVEIEGPSRVVYQPDQPLKCGARVWIETYAPVRILGKG